MKSFESIIENSEIVIVKQVSDSGTVVGHTVGIKIGNEVYSKKNGFACYTTNKRIPTGVKATLEEVVSLCNKNKSIREEYNKSDFEAYRETQDVSDAQE